MFCKKCGKQLKDGVLFCTYCGEKVTLPNVSSQIKAEDVIQEQEPVKEQMPVKELESLEEQMPVQEIEPVEELEFVEESVHKEPPKNLFQIVIIGVLILVIIGLVVGYFIRSGHSKESDEDVEAFSSQEMDSESEETEEMAEESPVEKAEEPAEPEEAEPLAEPAEESTEEGIHTYELIVSDVTWMQAYDDCLARGGHLVRINSEEEYQAILQQIREEDKNNIKFWLGGMRTSADSYEYRWVYEDGTYGDEILNQDDKYLSYWLSGEPSYQGETPEDQEMYLNMFYRGKEERWVWNDVPNDIIAVVNSYSGTVGYICEYEN